ncbi:cGMP-dependent protein kinase 1-like [Branchiostoma floridae x Branchiostoma belcheri]
MRPQEVMGGGASTQSGSSGPNNRNRNQTSELTEQVYQLISRCLYSLPLPQGAGSQAVNDALVERVTKYFTKVEFEDAEILKRGEPAKGIFVVIEGLVEVVSDEDNKIVLSSVTDGEFFGEVSTLFNMPTSATVRTPGRTTLAVLKAEDARRLLPPTQTNLLDWYIQRRYFDTNAAVDKIKLSRKKALAALKQVPMLQGWSDDSLKSLIMSLETDIIILYPSRSAILFKDDPSEEVFVLVKGKVDVLDGKARLATLQAGKSPICLGEEGLMTSGSRKMTIRASQPSQLMVIKRWNLHRTSNEFIDDAGRAWEETQDRWKQQLAQRDRNLYNKFGAFLQIEILIKKFRQSALFSDCPVGLIYLVAMAATGEEHATGKSVLTEDEYEAKTLFLILRGSAHMISDDGVVDSFVKGDAFWNLPWYPRKCWVRAKEQTIIVKYSESSVREALGEYPDAKLNIPQRSSHEGTGNNGRASNNGRGSNNGRASRPQSRPQNRPRSRPQRGSEAGTS